MKEPEPDTQVYVVSSRWGTTIHLAVTYKKYRRGKPPEIRVVQDHPSCQVGKQPGPFGFGFYSAMYIGPYRNVPGAPWIEPRLCKRCWDPLESLPKKPTAKDLRRIKEILEVTDEPAPSG
jgi:hypothetical protein